DPSRRLVEDEDLRVGGEPLGDDDLLLVASGEVPHLLANAWRLDVESMNTLLRGRARLAEIDQTDGIGEPAQGGKDDVRLDVHPDREAVPLAVLREVADAQTHGVGRAMDM